MRETGDAWHWKAPNADSGRQPRLLYEPGNWGDVLKGTWAIIVARTVARSRRARALSYLDPFAGLPVYPLLESSQRRLSWLGGGRYVEAQRPWLRRGELAGTATLVRDAVRNIERSVELRVYDLDTRAREAWATEECATVLDVSSGEEALGSATADLVLVDPYDFFDRWSTLLEPSLRAGASAAVLLYLLNRSPRGGGHARNYRAFRDRLATLAPEEVLVGRVPTDTVLPRGYHEIILVASSDVCGAVRRPLEEATATLAGQIAVAGCFESR